MGSPPFFLAVAQARHACLCPAITLKPFLVLTTLLAALLFSAIAPGNHASLVTVPIPLLCNRFSSDLPLFEELCKFGRVKPPSMIVLVALCRFLLTIQPCSVPLAKQCFCNNNFPSKIDFSDNFQTRFPAIFTFSISIISKLKLVSPLFV